MANIRKCIYGCSTSVRLRWGLVQIAAWIWRAHPCQISKDIYLATPQEHAFVVDWSRSLRGSDVHIPLSPQVRKRQQHIMCCRQGLLPNDKHSAPSCGLRRRSFNKTPISPDSLAMLNDVPIMYDVCLLCELQEMLKDMGRDVDYIPKFKAHCLGLMTKHETWIKKCIIRSYMPIEEGQIHLRNPLFHHIFALNCGGICTAAMYTFATYLEILRHI